MTDYVPIEVAVSYITTRAVFCTPVDDPDEALWIPLSLIHEEDHDIIEVGEVVEINVEEWFVEKEGLL